MRQKLVSFAIFMSFFVGTLLNTGSSRAEESPPKSKSTQSKGRPKREKEAEGTKAPNRFDSDVVTKSKYEQNGQPLEVDTE